MFARIAAAVCISLAGAAAVAVPVAGPVIPLDGRDWRLAPDAKNVGIAEKWWEAPRPEAKQATVPGLIQDVFPGYAGVAWFWRDVAVPANPHQGGRYLLRFWEVDYVADVWMNGRHVGRHEGAQAKFTLDVTSAAKPGEVNRIAIRVLSIFDRPIEGFVRSQTPHGGYVSINFGGIIDSAELVVAPQVRMDDLFVRADPKTGKIRVEAEICNESNGGVQAAIDFAVAPATSGEAVSTVRLDQELKPGVNTVRTEMRLANPRLWQLNDPYLYRMTGRVTAAGSKSVGETSTRFGFRDFRFKNGYFRLNGRRVFWRSAHSGADGPGRIRLPHDPDLLRRDLLDLKTMGFNGIRFISTMPPRYQLEMCDEIGLMVYEESYASWQFQASSKLAERMDRTLTAMVLRDRNHPSVVMWGLLNETGLGDVFNQAVASLPLMRRLDDSRIVMLGSGRFDAIGNDMNGLEIWKPEGGVAPCLTHNPKSYGICAVTLWRPNEVAVIPGTGGEYGSVRWTAPADGDYAISAKFRGTGTFTTTDVHVLQAGKPLYSSFINLNGHGDRCIRLGDARLSKGETLDFVVGGRTPVGGSGTVRWDTNTTFAVAIKSGGGKTYDLAADFSNSKNPSGAWSYGWLAAGASPDASTFKPYAKCETEKYNVIGGLSNPGSDCWEDVLADTHYYPRVPHRELEIARLRTFAGNDHHQFLSEYGVGSAVSLPRFLRQCEQNGLAGADSAKEMRERLATFMYAWNKLKLADTFATPENFFNQCVAKEAAMKRMGINAVRSNPNIIGYGMTGCNDPLGYGEGFITAFREFKPGTADALFDGFYPVRWCTFAEPVSVYRGAKVHLEAVLANEDAAPPGRHPARVEVFGPDNRVVFRKSLAVTIPEAKNGREPAFAIPVFSEEVPIDGPSGKYRLLVTFEQGVAASGGESEFYVTDPADMPPVEADVALWGNDPELLKWLLEHGVKVHPYKPGGRDAHAPGKRSVPNFVSAKTGLSPLAPAGEAYGREVILVSYAPDGNGDAEASRDLAARIAEGSTAVFLTLNVFKKGDDPLGWLPLAGKGTMGMVCEYTFPQVYLKDEWAKKHPLFDGLPSGGLMDYTFYREIIPDWRYWGQEIPAESVAGAFRNSAAGECHSELMLSVYNLGAGRFILNSLRVRQELGRDPTAERLLRNMLRYAARDVGKAAAQPKGGHGGLLKAIGYE